MSHLLLERGIELHGWKDAQVLQLGAIIGHVNLVDCVTASRSPWFVGDYGFVMRDPVLLPEPVPCRGYQKFWMVPDDLREKLAQADRQ